MKVITCLAFLKKRTQVDRLLSSVCIIQNVRFDDNVDVVLKCDKSVN